jgi:hypothetical protein
MVMEKEKLYIVVGNFKKEKRKPMGCKMNKKLRVIDFDY